MFTRKPSAKLSGTELLHNAVREHMPDADAETQRLVVSVCGLLASVAYVDRQYKDSERERVKQALTEVDGLNAAGVDAICAVLETQMIDIATINPQQYTRDLREHTAVEFRREVLDLLLEVAASDDMLTLIETDLLRRTVAALGLTQDDYLHAQTRYRDKLQAIKR